MNVNETGAQFFHNLKFRVIPVSVIHPNNSMVTMLVLAVLCFTLLRSRVNNVREAGGHFICRK